MNEDKEIIRRRFARSLKTYEEEAQAQEQIAASLARLIQANQIKATRALEIGAGSGLLTRRLFELMPNCRWFLNDIMDDLDLLLQKDWKEWGSSGVEFIAGDAEKIVFPTQLDLIVSASTFQWFDDLPKFLKKCSDALSPGGMMVFSTFGGTNLKEIRAITGNGLCYPSIEKIEEVLSPEFDIDFLQEEKIRLVFEKPEQVLRHLSKTGVNGSGCKCWSKSDLQCFCEKYVDQFMLEKGVTLTYHPIYIIAKKHSD